MLMKIILAYSGGLDTSALAATNDREVGGLNIYYTGKISESQAEEKRTDRKSREVFGQVCFGDKQDGFCRSFSRATMNWPAGRTELQEAQRQTDDHYKKWFPFGRY